MIKWIALKHFSFTFKQIIVTTYNFWYMIKKVLDSVFSSVSSPRQDKESKKGNGKRFTIQLFNFNVDLQQDSFL